MNPACEPLQTVNTDAAALCNWLILSCTRTLDQIDRGVQFVNFVDSPPHIETVADTADNGVLEAQEVFNAIIEVLEQEESNAFARSSFSVASFLHSDFVLDNTSFRVPTLLSYHAPGIARNTALMTQIAGDIGEMKERISENGNTTGTAGYNRALAEELVNYIRSGEHFVIEHSIREALHELNVVELLTSTALADCTEFSYLYYELCRLAGLDARIIQVTVDQQGKRVDHFCVALYLNPQNPEEITMVDLTLTPPFLSTPHREWVELPKIDVVAHYRLNVGNRPPQSIIEQGNNALMPFRREEYFTAFSYDTKIPLLLFSISEFYEDRGNYDLALTYLQRAFELNPHDGETAAALDRLRALISQ